MSETHTNETTQKNNLLAAGQTELQAAEAAYLALDKEYQYSHAHVDKLAALDAWNKWQAIRKLYAEAHQIMIQRELARQV